MIYPHKDKIDLKGNIFPLNEEEIEGGKFHHKKDSISNIALYNSRNSRLFKGKRFLINSLWVTAHKLFDYSI